MAARKKRVAIIDDTPLLRHGLRSLIDECRDLTVVLEVATPAEAIRSFAENQPDLIISEVVFRGSEGIFELLRDLQARDLRIPVLAFSHFDERVMATRVLQAGALGYLMKSASETLLLRVLGQLLAGRVYLSPAMTERTIDRLAAVHGARSELSRSEQLTNRELEVFELVGDGRSSKEIAEALHICLKTVESHRANIRAKLGLENSAELICYASRWRGAADDRGLLISQGTK